MGTAMRCLIVDDSQSFRCAAISMLERGGIAVVGLAANSADGLRYYRDLRPDVTLVDVDLGEESGFDLVEQLCRERSAATIAGDPDLGPRRTGPRRTDRRQRRGGIPVEDGAVASAAIVELVDGHRNGDRPVSAPPER